MRKKKYYVMSKLKKYSNFEDLKSDIKPDKPASEKDNKVLLEFEAFLKLLQRQFSSNEQKKETHGKQFNWWYYLCL